MPGISTTELNIVQLCQRSQVGKILPDALYVHASALSKLDPALQKLEQLARKVTSQVENATIIKFSFNKPQIVYLFYPDFDAEAHPVLQSSIQVNLKTLEAGERDYSKTDNPPVLHRKETFVTPDYPHYATFAWLTKQEEVLGLLEDSRGIGLRQAWERRLRDRTLVIHDHYLACPIQTGAKPTQAKPKIQRHKAAIARVTASKPVRLAVEAGLFPSETTYFDYGCGHGADIEYIKRLGLFSAGWDPYYRPDESHVSADVVNLGYIINVIEDTAERREALVNAWNLAQKVLIVAAQVLISDRTRGVIAYGDGIITSRNTFQKYYEQEELKSYIDQVLGVDAIPVALGIYFVFRDEAQAEIFRASRFRSRATAPRIRLKVNKFEEYRELLQPLMDFYTDRGRLPAVEELDQGALGPLQSEFGSIKRAFKVILQATDAGEWDAISDKRRNDLLVYLALSHFGKRPKFKDLSPTIRTDIKALFGSYQQACTAADLMLMSLGRTELIEERCRQSAIGQQRPNSLWVHVSAIDQLDPLLRLYEGCASRTIRRPEVATVVKFHVQKPQITYLFYPSFDKEPHPALHTSMAIGLRDLHVRYRDYDPENPPLLHQKDQLITEDYPGYAKFAKLSQQERKWGLLEDPKAIFDHHGWEQCLAERGAELRGHRVVWRKDATEYQRQSAR
ncbi:DNA phosphorothioation-associated putative methyltransferase [Leptolyngbya iicbica]|uniref:DNA phosphorothioation-associated putative methyltransferase n=3 Tax=Cyanophyceae TaxID=3028117 RepID=A0A4Q7E7T6_9CYAN|nr:DNA phosphorothioation-associated putative methyltransferase [Leptolyngbya sp. LK]RZM78642.1 DNA phosphorothioation-associated putative methyltransferase [Leptolyngbya sp. LK]